jgi:MFS family permease
VAEAEVVQVFGCWNMPVELVEVEQTQQPVKRRRRMFRALSHRNYRLFWTGAFLSNTGTWMQAVAQGWLVLQLTDSAFWLGVDGFMAMAPGLVLTLAGGVFSDWFDRRRLLLYTQIVAGSAALGLAVFVSTGIIKDSSDVWMILIFSFITGCCMSLAGPSYQAITFDMVGREDLANAVALNSTQFQLSRVIGPALAGVGFKVFSLAGCFYVNGISFIAVVVALSMVKFEPKPQSADHAQPVHDRRALWHDLVEGIRYVRSRPRVFILLTISAFNSFFGAPYLTFVPIFARDIFHLGASGLAWLMGTAGAGAFFGALILAYLGDFKRKGWTVIGGSFAFGLCLIAFSLSSHLTLSFVFLFGVGFSIVTSVAVANTLLQQLVTDQMRGRVMSMFILSFIGTMPFANLIAGVASHRFGAPHTLAVGGVVVVLFAVSVAVTNRPLRELH